MRRGFKILLGALAVLALVAIWSQCWAAEPYEEGDSVVRALYRYQDETIIPSTQDDTRHHGIGIGYGFFMAEDVSLEVSGWLPVGDAGADTACFGAGLNYYFDHIFVPLEAIYRGDLNSLTVGSGIGLDFPLGNITVLQAKAGPQYVLDSDVGDDWTWGISGSIGWQFAGK